MPGRSEEQVRKAPVRARMLDLYEGDRTRSLSARDLIGELRESFGEVPLAQVQYHLTWLRAAGLNPAAGDKGH
jgi:Fe2+ or Zn2+ uptake regulation protein